MRVLSVIVLLTALILPTVVFAEAQTFTATRTYLVGDHDRKDNVRQVDAGVRDDVSAFEERLKRLGAQLEAMQREQGGQSSRYAPPPPQIDISVEDLQMLHAQAAQGDVKAQNVLGLVYDVGWGVPQDYAKARQWYEKSAVKGYALAQTNLGVLYHNGEGVPQDYAKARQWYEKSAAQGHKRAQTNLGWLYSTGHGVSQDYAKARQWYERAAAQGYALAQHNLGVLYQNGKGAPRDYAEATQLYEKAAVQGYAEAQYNLGVAYRNGLGVPQNYVRAYMWLNLATEHLTGDVQRLAVKKRGEVASRMTPAQIAEAQRLAQQCQAQQFKGC